MMIIVDNIRILTKFRRIWGNSRNKMSQLLYKSEVMQKR
jgi:hypothetical protein